MPTGYRSSWDISSRSSSKAAGAIRCAHAYVDLSLFQVMRGLEYMFPRRMRTLSKNLPLLQALTERVSQRPNIAAYLASERRVAFNTNGIFRHYPELDAA